MAVVVDEAMWPWRGERWAHLASDRDIDELHRFADALGLRRLSFQGDHYDVPAPLRERAIALGAVPIGGRELVRRLRAAGLRRPGGCVRWERAFAAAPPARFDVDVLGAAGTALAAHAGRAVARALVDALTPLAEARPALVDLGVAVLHRPGGVALALDVAGDEVPTGYGPVVAPGGPAVVTRLRPGPVWALEALLAPVEARRSGGGARGRT